MLGFDAKSNGMCKAALLNRSDRIYVDRVVTNICAAYLDTNLKLPRGNTTHIEQPAATLVAA